MLDSTSRTVAAWDAGRVVGFGRALCDGVANGYLSMVAVAEEARGQGIGREIVRRLMRDDPEITWTLRAGRGSEGFWRKMGLFAVSEIAMERTRPNDDHTQPGDGESIDGVSETVGEVGSSLSRR